MKTIKVTTDDVISIIDVNFDDYKDIQKAIGCDYFETVKTRIMFNYFDGPMLMCVDDSGLINGSRENKLGSLFYGTGYHRTPICGNIVFGLLVYEDIEGPKNVEEMKEKLLRDFNFLKEGDNE